MRAIAFLHRWLGIAFCLLFAVWFVSGIVMMYARMPELSREERHARLPLLDLSAARVSPAAASREVSTQRVRVGMLLGRPVYRVATDRESSTIFADTGERPSTVTAEQALDEARRFDPAAVRTVRYDAWIDQPDQWTLQSRAMLPMHRIALGDAGGTFLYVSERSGEIVVKTTATERRVAYAGAVLHWLYFTPFRKHSVAWAQTIIWLSIAGTLMCVLGLTWGLYVGVRSPYRGWMRWHHYAGLVFGVITCTWIFSGLLSMDPWDWHPGTSPTRAQRDRLAGGPLRLDRVALEDLRGALAGAPAAKEIEIVPFEGQPRLLVDGRAAAPVDERALMAAAREALPGAAVEDAVWLDRYDSYYYDRRRGAPLPVLRVRFSDPSRTWLYLDPQRGAIVRKEERLSRLNRWLYHGLHSLDFAGLYDRRPLWDAVVIVLSVGGIASAVTSTVPAWRRLRRHARRLL